MKNLPDYNIKFKPCYGQEYFIAKHPKIGSGKITRRVYCDFQLVTRRSNKRKKKKKAEYASSVLEKRPPFVDFEFPDRQRKQIFTLWNQSGYPFVRHNKQRSKTTDRIFSLLKPICNKYEQRQIINSIRDAHILFCAPNFVFRFVYKKKIGLHTFLELSAEQQRHFFNLPFIRTITKKHGVALPQSWFKESLKGLEHLRKKYCIGNAIKDDHPILTEQAIRMMNSHKRREINDKGKNDLVKFSRMLVNWGKLNDIDPYWLIDHIETALNDYKTMRIDKVYYLTTEIFWADTLPSELIRYDKLHYEGRDFVYEKDKMLK